MQLEAGSGDGNCTDLKGQVGCDWWWWGGMTQTQGYYKDQKVHRGHGSAAAGLRQLLGPPTPTGSPTHRLSDSGGWRHIATAPHWQAYHWSRTRCWGRCTCVKMQSERHSRNALGTAQICSLRHSLSWQTKQSKNRQWLESNKLLNKSWLSKLQSIRLMKYYIAIIMIMVKDYLLHGKMFTIYN